MPSRDFGPAPLAIIGMGCLFPKGEGPAEFWSTIAAGVDGITAVPPTHWRPEDYFDADPKSPDRTYAARGGFLPTIDFDPMAYGISPNNLEAIDSAQLLGLVVADAALRDAGYGPERSFDRDRVSVILGVTGTLELVIPLGARLGHPLWRRALRDAGVPAEVAEEVVARIGAGYVPWQENSFPGLLGNVVAGRVANRLNLGGTNCVVDAACASSLSALHLAALELGAGRSDMVLTGGVDTFNDIFMYMCFSKTPALSPTGESRPFADDADGTILGEGIGMVVVKRLADAERDGDRIHAVIRGLGSSSDGKGNAVYAPSAPGQAKALRRAYELAGVSPATVELVEAHGTGTKVGDATEAESLAEVFSSSAAPGGSKGSGRGWCALGSIKSQIGHTKAAAGVAGLIKAALALETKTLPPTIKVKRPLPGLEDGAGPFYVNTTKRPWMPAADHPRRAAVSAFGFGGSNFHCVLEEYETEKARIDWDDVQIVPLSAGSRKELAAALERAAREWAEITSRAAARRAAALARKQFRPSDPARLIFVIDRQLDDWAKVREAALTHLRAEDGSASWSVSAGSAVAYFGAGQPTGKLAVLFPGQGSQYVGMLRDLACAFPRMRSVLDEADRAFAQGAAAGSTRLTERIYPKSCLMESDRRRLEEELRATDVAQPALGAVSLGALLVLRELGVEPQAACGHSYGELTALCAAGRFRLGDLLSLSMLRGRLMAAGDRDRGAMLAVQAPLETIAAVTREEQIELVIANRNAPNQAVLSGRTPEIERAERVFKDRKIRGVRLPVAAAFHSELVAQASKPFRAALDKIELGPASMPVFANTTAEAYPDNPLEARELLAGQLARPVEFVEEIRNLYRDGARMFLEVGPGAKLTGLVGSILEGREHIALALDSGEGRRSGLADLARVLARLAALGHPARVDAWDPDAESQTEPRNRPGAHTVPINGANYLRPRAPLPPSRRVLENQKAAPPMTTVDSTSIPAPKIPSPAAPVHSAPAPAPALAEAMRIANEHFVAIQRMQEQTAEVHRRFLEGQEAAQKNLLSLIEVQRGLLHSSMGLAVAPAALPAAAPAYKAPEIQAPSVAPIAPPSQTVAVAEPKTAGVGTDQIVALVAEKTGYPAEMLGLDMELDGDLGIDSIKRVEIFSAFQEKYPELPVVSSDKLGTLRTLRDVVEFLGTANEMPAEASRPAATGPGTATGIGQEEILALVAEKTGYPIEMLGLDHELDGDLGIDSIKRVEIFSAFQERFPEAPVVQSDQLGSFRRLRDVIEFLASGPSAPPAPAATKVPAKPAETVTVSAASGVERWTARLVSCSSTASDGVRVIRPGSEVWIIDDGSELSPAVQAEWVRRGMAARVVTGPVDQQASLDKLGGLVVLCPASGTRREWLTTAFGWVQQAVRRFGAGGGFLASVSRLDGGFGFADGPIADPLSGGLAGLVKTAALEYPGIVCRALDLADDFGSPAEEAAAIVDALTRPADADAIELGISAAGPKRVELVGVPDPTDEPSRRRPIEPGDVVLVTGGARGVTAAVAVALARRYQPTLVLLGRAANPEAEPPWLAGLAGEDEIRRALLERAGSGLAPRELRTQVTGILQSRAMRATFRAIEAAGGTSVYYAVDIRDERRVEEVLARVRNEHGPIRGIVHGAGVLADRRLEDKTAEQFASVVDTKVHGLQALLAGLDPEELRLLVPFSSSTARFGRVGQVDYAVANECLNKLAQGFARRYPDCRVLAANWGPWAGGMVTESLAKLFRSEGVELIGLAEGSAALIADIERSPRPPVEVVYLGAGSRAPGLSRPPSESAAATPDEKLESTSDALAVAFERTLDLAGYPVLDCHRIKGHPVLPMALMAEWLAHAALHENPGLVFHGFDDLRVTKGVVLADDEPLAIRVLAGKAAPSGPFHVSRAELRSTGTSDVPRATARIVLASKLPPEERRIADEPTSSPELVPETLYEEVLFHGPLLRGIERIIRCDEKGIDAWSRPAPGPAAWIRRPLRGSWLADPLVLDVAFQLMIVWTTRQRGIPSLPCHVRGYRQFARAFPTDGTRILVQVKRGTEHRALADIEFLDRRGSLVARIEDYECVLDPSLALAFAEGRLAGAAQRSAPR